MKKTIAILLVLVIGMVGVWAATAELNLTTTVYEFNQMIIVGTSSETPVWANFPGTGVDGEGNPITNVSPAGSTYTSNTNRKAINPYTSTAQNVGYLHTRTNNRLGYAVTVSAGKLTSEVENETLTIDYTVSNDTGIVYNTATATAGVAGDFLEVDVASANGTALTGGMRSAKTGIYVTLIQVGDQISAGTYTGDITFEYTAN